MGNFRAACVCDANCEGSLHATPRDSDRGTSESHVRSVQNLFQTCMCLIQLYMFSLTFSAAFKK